MTPTPDPDLTTEYPVPPLCRPTVDRLQLVLDGELPGIVLDVDPHLGVCDSCRQRIAAARLLITVLSMPLDPVPLPSGLADRVLSAVRSDRGARIRRRAFAFAGGLAVAAMILIALRWFGGEPGPNALPQTPDQANVTPELAPAPHVAPEPRPMRLGEEFSKAQQALRDSSRPITEPATVAPRVLAKLTDVLTRPSDPFEPARISLVDLPDAARNGLEPVAATAQKAFARLMRDVGAVSAKPKS